MQTLMTFGAAAVALVVLLLMMLWMAQKTGVERLRVLTEQVLAGQRAEAETSRRQAMEGERAVLAVLAEAGASQARSAGDLTTLLAAEQGRLRAALADEREKSALAAEQTRAMLEHKLRELREGNEARLAQIERTVNEQLAQVVEQQMTASFARVVDQFTAVQKAMGDVQAVTAQIGDIKRLFSNVKTRGGWGEAQVRALLDDILPPGSWEANCQVRENSRERVDFAVLMPTRGDARLLLPVDAKFPMEDYERLLAAADTGDVEGEREARIGLTRAIRLQAKRIGEKYIAPPATVEFAVMYLPTDGLYAEVARIPGMIDEIGRSCRVLILGPSLFPALLRTIQLGQVTLALERKTDEIRALLGVTKAEMLKMDGVLVALGKQAHGFNATIEKARTRTRVMNRKLREIEAVDAADAGEPELLPDAPELLPDAPELLPDAPELLLDSEEEG
jgi:DNA recombination protein RmuC